MSSFLKESIVYSTGQVLTRIVSFLLVPFFTHIFSPEQTGKIYIFYSTLAFLNVISNHGLDAALLKYIGEKKWKQEDVIKSLFVYQAFILAILYTLLVVISEPLSNLIFGNNHYYWIYILGAILVCDTMTQRGMVLLRINSKANLFITISISNIVLTILGVYYFVLYKEYEVVGVFHGIFFASFIQFIIIFIFVYLQNINAKISFKIIKKMVKFGFPFLPAGILFLITELSDRYFILWFLGESHVGIYSIAYKIGSIPMILISGINLAWQPFYVKKENTAKTRKELGEIGSIILFGFIILLTILSIWLPLINSLGIISSIYSKSLKIIPIIFISYLFYTWYILIMPSIFLEEKQNWAPIFRGSAAVSNIILNLLLIPKYGILGAAIATMIAYFVMSSFLFYKNKQWMDIPIKYLNLILFFILSCGVVKYSMYNTINFNIGITIIYIIISYWACDSLSFSFKLKKRMFS